MRCWRLAGWTLAACTPWTRSIILMAILPWSDCLSARAAISVSWSWQQTFFNYLVSFGPVFPLRFTFVLSMVVGQVCEDAVWWVCPQICGTSQRSWLEQSQSEAVAQQGPLNPRFLTDWTGYDWYDCPKNLACELSVLRIEHSFRTWRDCSLWYVASAGSSKDRGACAMRGQKFCSRAFWWQARVVYDS